MSILKQNTEESKKFSFKSLLLPAYIIFSVIFILSVCYSYIMGTIYKGWLMQGQKQWYTAAFQQIILRAEQKCEPIPLNFGKKEIRVINVACLDQQTPSIQENLSTEE